ncbi:MAG: hypothetical protein ACFFDN_21490, partial [Candidatus Hodarchaeota archaeon]
SKSWYPTHKAKEVAKKYLEFLAKYPPDESLGERIVQAAVRITKDGVNGTSVIKVKKGKLEELRTRALNAMAMFNEIEGFEYTIEIWSTREEALATIGMKLP